MPPAVVHPPLQIHPSGIYNDAFAEIASSLDAFNDRRERVVKASRDTTRDSKKVIFALLRYTPATRDTTLAAGGDALLAIRTVIAARIAKEVDAEMYPELQRSFSGGIQEYVEAAVLHAYLRDGRLVSQKTLSAEVADACRAEGTFEMHVDEGDYVLGVADTTGELMRLATMAGGKGDFETCEGVRVFLNTMVMLFEGIKLPGRAARDLRFKMGVMKTSYAKVELLCFNLCMRRAEFGNTLPMPPSQMTGAGGEEEKGRGTQKRPRNA